MDSMLRTGSVGLVGCQKGVGLTEVAAKILVIFWGGARVRRFDSNPKGLRSKVCPRVKPTGRAGDPRSPGHLAEGKGRGDPTYDLRKGGQSCNYTYTLRVKP